MKNQRKQEASAVLKAILLTILISGAISDGPEIRKITEDMLKFLASHLNGPPAGSGEKKTIGVVSQPLPKKILEQILKEASDASNYASLKQALEGSSYIPSRYLKWLKNVHIRPINIKSPMNEIEEQIGQVHGLVFPGGSTKTHEIPEFIEIENGVQSNPHKESNEIFLERMHKIIHRVDQHNREKPIPISMWGTCLGMEILASSKEKNPEVFSRVENFNTNHSITFVDDNKTEIGALFTQEEKDLISRKSPFFFNHKYAIHPSSFEKFTNLFTNFDIVALSEANKSEIGEKIISILSHKEYPVYGVQFHPEKNGEKNSDARSDDESVGLAEKLANFFVDKTVYSHKANPDDFWASHYSNKLFYLAKGTRPYDEILILA
jgi:gamma-glutamyl hydrolase